MRLNYSKILIKNSLELIFNNEINSTLILIFLMGKSGKYFQCLPQYALLNFSHVLIFRTAARKYGRFITKHNKGCCRQTESKFEASRTDRIR